MVNNNRIVDEEGCRQPWVNCLNQVRIGGKIDCPYQYCQYRRDGQHYMDFRSGVIPKI